MEKRIRHSKQRDMIYDYLMSTKEHPSADMVYESLKPDMPNLSLGTVYRNLKLLEEMGLIRRVTTLQSTERYDANCKDHAHFECDTCGCVKDLEILDLQKAKESCGVDENDNIKWMNLVFGGTCRECVK
ncbi:MAG: transcriptional repressor [Anaerofustis stercorihominis]|nr:transcriptional repressor [Anaerofustis stercorihominis]